ncbi:cell division protein sepF [Companilactobacillus paralimentarius DSM 13238 = JCM 10415]|uniref:Cell division protein SepF n=3 Tax=Companilactobacillus TaxID=2767879 RepID=A0ABR5NWB0_9LACO|nr:MULTISPECIES: cell division protein SepF [Companilactobacillus]KAE9561224.1 cell division protein SepF [Companilactobacillus kimchii]KAE9564016.1 cell division protein SepF [Companilactobacillus paralimentarius]KRK53199.1 cell division protein sepF [Companilactobacillus kimchii DSM 13961 = JCM 10707]KRL32209.1 cell division protein sepF [Companilactobacillus paralimentarius DSM 13238 = JCM 10415]MDR4933745.1 cell division protein SepF [Companilactobacillus paralimentarius]
MAFEKLSSFFGINDDEDFEEKPVETPQPKKNYSNNEKVVSMSAASESRSAVNSKIAIYQPRVYSDAKVIAKQLLNNKAVIVNFNNVNDEQSKRIVDFLTGTIFALNGEIKRVGEKIFLCTPPKFEIDGSIPDINE